MGLVTAKKLKPELCKIQVKTDRAHYKYQKGGEK